VVEGGRGGGERSESCCRTSSNLLEKTKSRYRRLVAEREESGGSCAEMARDGEGGRERGGREGLRRRRISSSF
jgi:hypothetical protein